MSGTLLWVNHVPLRCEQGQWLLDIQTCDLLGHLSQEFDRIILAGVVWPQPPQDVLTQWQAIAHLPWARQLELLPLPSGYIPLAFLRHYPAVRSQLRSAIQRSDYLCFLPSTFLGDWPGVGCLEAIALGRSYAIWNDRVERDVILQSMAADPPWKQVILRAIAWSTHHYNHSLMRRATLGLLQGQSCFTEFAKDFRAPHQYAHSFNYINTQPGDAIRAEELEAKVHSLNAGAPLRIGYVGRAAEMKGPLDWLAVLARLRDLGVPFQATWVGDGPLLGQMRQQVVALGLSDHVSLPGSISDRQRVLELTKSFHLILCCHRTAESARCLQEALVCGCPIVAYHSAYVEGLLEQYHCGISRPIGDSDGLAEVLRHLHALDSSRTQLHEWIMAAAHAGASLDAEATFRQVGRLIQQHLSLPAAAQRSTSLPSPKAGATPC